MSDTRNTNIAIRARPEDRDLIDHAARILGKTRSEFMLETARERANQVLCDQTVFHLDEGQWQALMVELDRPPNDNPGLLKLFQHKPPWDV